MKLLMRCKRVSSELESMFDEATIQDSVPRYVVEFDADERRLHASLYLSSQDSKMKDYEVGKTYCITIDLA